MAPADRERSAASEQTPDSGGERDRRRTLLEQAEATPPAWAWPERMALAGLGALLAGLVLPWASDPAGDPLWLGQAGRPNGLLVAIVAAAVVVPAQLAAGYRWEGFEWFMGAVGTAAVISACVVRDADPFDDLQPFVPGRVAAVVGGAALVAATWGSARAWAARRQVLRRLYRLGRRETRHFGRPERPSEVAARVRAMWSTGPRGAGWVSAALVLVAAGAAALAGPWWPGVRVQGPGDVSTPSDPVLGVGESARTIRSGIEALGATRSWAVAGAVLVATVAVVWLGGRRPAARVVVAAGAFVLGLAAASLTGPETGDVPAPIATVVAAGIGLAVAGVTLLRARSRGVAATVPLLVVVPGLLAVTWSAVDDPPHPETDGPYRVLIGGPPEHGGTASLDGAPAAETLAHNLAPVWVDGRPGAVGMTASEDGSDQIGLWVVDGGRVEVRTLVEDEHRIWPTIASAFEVSDDGTVLARASEEDDYGVIRSVILPLGHGGGAWLLPQGTEGAWFGPDGRVRMSGASPERIASDEEVAWSAHTTYVADVDELARPETASTTIGEWPRASRPEPDDGVVPAGADEERAERPEEPRRPVLGGAPDQRCGLNRQAAASYVEEDWEQVDDPSAHPLTFGPYQREAPAPDGGLWAALPTPDPDDGRYLLGKVDPDGTLRLVDHELPAIEGITLSPDGHTVVVVDTRGRLLELPDAEAALEPAPPPPDGCYTEEPDVAPPARVTELDVGGDGILLDTAGTALVPSAPTPGVWPPTWTRVTPDGTETVVADGRLGPWPGDIVPDGAGGAWWFETTQELSRDQAMTTSFDVRLVRLRASGAVERSPLIAYGVGPRFHGIGLWAHGDMVHLRGLDTIWHVQATRADVVHRGAGVQQIDGRYGTVVVTRDGGVFAQRDDTALYHLVGDRLEALVGTPGPPSDQGPPPARQDPPYRRLSVELAAGTAPHRIHVRGRIVEDPHGDGVLLVQDGLLVRITADGRVIPLAQDERLDQEQFPDLHLAVLDGRLVVQTSAPADQLESLTFVVEVPR